MTCIIVDDELAGIKVLTDYVQRTDFLALLETFQKSTDALTYLKSNKVDVVFLDINMPHVSGIDMVSLLDEHYSSEQGPKVIFNTAYRGYAVDGYDYNRVIGFLHKPYQYSRFLKTVTKSQNYIDNNLPTAEKKPEHVIFEYRKKKFRVALDDILYAMSEKNYTSIATTDQTYRILKSITEVEKMLPADQFVRIHKSYIVAINKVEKIEYLSLQLKGLKATFRIGPTYRENVKKIIDNSL